MARMALIGLAMLSACAAHAEPLDCPKVMENIKGLSAGIAETSDAYWKRRKDYIDLKFAQKRHVADAAERAEREEKLAAPLRDAVADKWDRLSAALADAQSKNCASAADLSAIREPAFARAKPVKIDRFPEDE